MRSVLPADRYAVPSHTPTARTPLAGVGRRLGDHGATGARCPYAQDAQERRLARITAARSAMRGS